MTPQAESVIQLFRATGAYLEGHFRLTSGLHSPNYLQCALVLRHADAAEKMGRALAEALRQPVQEPISLVVSPALGGVIIGHEVARALGVPFLFTERDPATRAAIAFASASATASGSGHVRVRPSTLPIAWSRTLQGSM